MALVVNNLITKGMSGRYGNVLVFKQYSGKTVATAYPKPTSKPPTALQIARRHLFAKAVAMTRLWLQNPEQKRFLEKLADKWSSLSPYHAGIKYFMLGQPPVLQNKQKAPKARVPHAPKALQQSVPEGATPPTTRKGNLYASLAAHFY